MNRFLTAAVVAVTLCSSLAACGGGGDDKLSREKLASKANDICNKAEKDVKAVKQPTNISTAKDAAGYFDKVAPIGDKETSDLKDLKPDADAKDDWNAFIAVQEEATKLIDTIRDKADKADASGLQDLQKVDPLTTRISAAANKAGVKSCS